MDKPKRYSDEVPYEKRRYWYFTLHGLGPGTIPKDLHVLETQEGRNDKGTLGLYICLDGVLNTSELIEYDLRELAPQDEQSIEDYIENYLQGEGWPGMIDSIWTDSGGLHIYVIEGDWKHVHLYLVDLMEAIGYTHTDELDEPSDMDAYTAEHIFIKA